MDIDVAKFTKMVKEKQIRAYKAYSDKDLSTAVRVNVILPELQILELAMMGLKQLAKDTMTAKTEQKQVSYDTPAVPTAVLPTD